jgi:Dihydroorotate dehydrogenase
MGGIRTGRDVLEFVACGANHVALGTTLFSDVDAPQRVREELRAALDAAGRDRGEDAFGIAHETVAGVDNHA